ncbi:GMC family oxidoreductase [Amylibacter sp. SFDW26]|uniref:GMC oxidoreductase n=1 Tax=Amylibacter sp. SFDW26 TaxID=2652722 RepID=UPI0012620076|nr:GMC family oxidoreductase [Amylibacter sp. SFDW26]KAB7613485.1 GMC family oxidoreductase [Amylibacter sp. SFDW26]
MQTIETHAVIIGSGVAGAIIAYKLSQSGVKTIILEAGPRFTREDVFERQQETWKLDSSAPYPNTKLAPRTDPSDPSEDYIGNVGGTPYQADHLRGVGGTTWHWAAACHRFLPQDMAINSNYGVGIDWPFSYSEIEPDYATAEKELGVSCEDNADWDSPRSTPYPMSAVAASYADLTVSKVLNGNGYNLQPKPVARNSRPYDNRPQCHGHHNCTNVCPIGAQYSGDVHINKAEEYGAQVLADALVIRLETDRHNRIKKAIVKRPDGSLLSVKANIFVLAANGIESPRLLLSSTSETHPNGIANSSGMVGKRLMDHYGSKISFDMPYPVFPGRGPVTAYADISKRDGDFRKKRSGYLISFINQDTVNNLTLEALQHSLDPVEIDTYLSDLALRRLRVETSTEQLPDVSNKVNVDFNKRDSSGMPKISIHYNVDSYVTDGVEASYNDVARMAKILGATNIKLLGTYTHLHSSGTLMMGHDNKRFVADDVGRSHDHPNLFIAGSALFPSVATTTPTLTISAMALRTARSILTQINK